MLKIILHLTAITAISLLTGCGTTGKFVYPANGSDLTRFKNAPVYNLKIAVPPFDEMRGDKNQFGTMFLYLIPLSPCGYINYDRPDAAGWHNTITEFEFNPSEDLAKAAAYSLRKSGLFNDAFFTYGGDKDKAQLLLLGNIYSTEYTGTQWSYGLSVFGPMLWTIGLPLGTSSNTLILELQVSTTKSGKVLWTKKYDVSKKITQGLYYKMGHDVRGYSYLMQEIMNDAVKEIHSKLGG